MPRMLLAVNPSLETKTLGSVKRAKLEGSGAETSYHIALVST